MITTPTSPLFSSSIIGSSNNNMNLPPYVPRLIRKHTYNTPNTIEVPSNISLHESMTGVDVVTLWDISGSMSNISQSLTERINKLITDQKVLSTVENPIRFTVVQFNDSLVNPLVERVNVENISNFETPSCIGGTALFSNLYVLLRQFLNQQRVIFVIITDGMNNIHTNVTIDTIKELITSKCNNGWDFLYLCSDVDNFNDEHGATSQGVSIGLSNVVRIPSGTSVPSNYSGSNSNISTPQTNPRSQTISVSYDSLSDAIPSLSNQLSNLLLS